MKKLSTFIFLVFLTLSLNAQNYYNKPQPNNNIIGFDKSKLTFGGSFGLQFGDYTVVDIAPQVGYNFSKYFNAGAGISYTYYKDDFYSGGDKYDDKRSYLGMNVYAKVYPTSFLVLMVQPEANRMWSTIEGKGFPYKQSENKFVPSVLVGGGLRLGPITAMLQYDIVQDNYSPYGNRIFYSIGYSFGF
jgi:hypothetical protein